VPVVSGVGEAFPERALRARIEAGSPALVVAFRLSTASRTRS
jgi:hypothetical protein